MSSPVRVVVLEPTRDWSTKWKRKPSAEIAVVADREDFARTLARQGAITGPGATAGGGQTTGRDEADDKRQAHLGVVGVRRGC